jgi:hypothetical protein
MKVGQIDCQLSPKIEVRFWSQNKTNTLVPRKLWGDSDDDDEESLPSPLPRLMNDEDVALVDDLVGSLPLKEVPPENLASFSVVPGKGEAALQFGVAADNVANPFAVVGMSEAVQNCVAAEDSVVFSAEAGLSAVSTAGDVAPKNCSPNVCKSTSKNKGMIHARAHGNEVPNIKCYSPSHEYKDHSHKISPYIHTVSSSSVLPNLSQGLHGKVGTGVFLGGRCSMEDVVKFGGISPPSKDLRSSERIRVQHNADDSQMARAQQLAQAKNVAHFSGTPTVSKFSLCAISDDTIFQRAQKLGVSLGGTSSQVTNTIANIKQVDNKRTLIMLSKSLEEKEKVDSDIQIGTLQLAQDLTSDLQCEDNLSAEELVPVREKKIVKVYKRREKKDKLAPRVVRRSVRLSKKVVG